MTHLRVVKCENVGDIRAKKSSRVKKMWKNKKLIIIMAYVNGNIGILHRGDCSKRKELVNGPINSGNH